MLIRKIEQKVTQKKKEKSLPTKRRKAPATNCIQHNRHNWKFGVKNSAQGGRNSGPLDRSRKEPKARDLKQGNR